MRMRSSGKGRSLMVRSMLYPSGDSLLQLLSGSNCVSVKDTLQARYVGKDGVQEDDDLQPSGC